MWSQQITSFAKFLLDNLEAGHSLCPLCGQGLAENGFGDAFLWGAVVLMLIPFFVGGVIAVMLYGKFRRQTPATGEG